MGAGVGQNFNGRYVDETMETNQKPAEILHDWYQKAGCSSLDLKTLREIICTSNGGLSLFREVCRKE